MAAGNILLVLKTIWVSRVIRCWVFWCVFLAFDFCRFCVVIRCFHHRHYGQWPPTSKVFLSQILSITIIFPSWHLFNTCPEGGLNVKRAMTFLVCPHFLLSELGDGQFPIFVMSVFWWIVCANFPQVSQIETKLMKVVLFRSSGRICQLM